MPVNLEETLERVVHHVFGGRYVTSSLRYDRQSSNYSAQVSRPDGKRSAIVRASPYWIDVRIPELDVGTISFDYDDDVEAETESELRRLCLVVRSYLEGEGEIEKRWRLFNCAERVKLRIPSDEGVWMFGRSVSSNPDPRTASEPGRRPR